jgi:hypothetical protein
MSRRLSTQAPRRTRFWALAAIPFAVLLLGSLGLSSESARHPLAERAAPAAVESISEEGWLRLRWQSLLPGMMK